MALNYGGVNSLYQDPRRRLTATAPTGLQPLPALGTTTTPTPETFGAPKPMVGPSVPGIAPTVPTTMAGQQPIGSPLPPPPSGLAITPGAQPNIGPTAPPPVGGPLQDFGPGNDLRSTQVNPYTGERLSGIQSGTDVLFRALQNGPNLTDAAKQAFDVLGQQTAERRKLGIQDIGRNAARLGRLGSGMVTTDLGNLEDTLQQHENQARQQLASQVAFSQGNEARANLGAAQGLENQIYGQGVGARNEVRGERDYQQQLAQRAQDQEILRKQLQVAYQQYLQQLGLQGAGLYGDQAAASQDAAANLLGGVL